MRLIDAEEVIKAVDKHTFETKDGLCLDDDISIILEDVPTVEKRKTGKWIHGREIAREMIGDAIVSIFTKIGSALRVGVLLKMDANPYGSFARHVVRI